MKMIVEIQPFTTPRYVFQKMPPNSRLEGLNEVPKYYISDIDPQILSDLCDQFRADIFEKANKPDPAKSDFREKN